MRPVRVATLEETLRYGRAAVRDCGLLPPMLGASTPPLSNSFESGQPDTTAITTGNSGGGAGNAFDNVTGGAFTTFSATHAHGGSLSCKCDSAATNQQSYVRWSSLGSLTTDVYWRMYAWLPNLPNANNAGKIINALVAAATVTGQFEINTAGHVVVNNAAASTAATGTGTIVATGQWIRLEGHIISATTNGTIEMRSWNSPESTGTPDDSCSSTTAVLGANTDRFDIGFPVFNNAGTYAFWIDDLAVGTTGWIGPTATAAVPELFSVSDPQGFRLPGIH